MGFCDLELALGESDSIFNLEKAVCNHGLFMMAPNRWIPSTKTLERPLRLADSVTSVMASISHPPNSSAVLIRVHSIDDRMLSSSDHQAILVSHRHLTHSLPTSFPPCCSNRSRLFTLDFCWIARFSLAILFS